MSAKSLILGASGFVGRALTRLIGHDRAVPVFCSRPIAGGIQFDASRESPGDLFARAGDGVGVVYLLHGIANPDVCARDPAATARINVEGMKALIDEAIARSIVPIFTSSDYVFDGRQGSYDEHAPLSPSTEYGRQKAAIERHVLDRGCGLVLRLSKVVGEHPVRQTVIGELVEPLMRGDRLRMASDQVFSPAHVDDIARALDWLPGQRQAGILNLAGARSWSRYDLACRLFAALRERNPRVRGEVTPCRLSDLPFVETRPLNTSLNTATLHGLLPFAFRSMDDVCEAAAAHLGAMQAT